MLMTQFFSALPSFCLSALAIALALTSSASAIDLSVPAVNGDISRVQLGDGTDVVVGVIDSGVDDTHPALSGFDTLGQSRLVAEANFVTYEAGNTGDDVFGHGTQIASVIGSADSFYTGLAPDARFINSRVLDNGNGFPDDIQVRNGVGFAIDQGADVLNLSLNYFSVFSSGNGQLDLMIDWAAAERGVSSAICAGNISQAQGGAETVRGPGGAYNGVTVGLTDFDFNQVASGSANAFTQDGRMKPDLVAPGTSITMANDDWETQSDFNTASGCSFATPHVAGLMAQQIEAGRNLGLSTSPLVLKTTIMNAASKDVLDKQGNPWSAVAANQPLDTDSGAGQIDGLTLAEQYLAGEQESGIVDSIGWDLGTVSNGAFADYVLDLPAEAGSFVTATLSWFRHVGRTDQGPVGVDASDSFFLADPVDNLDLQILADGVVVAESLSEVDTVEHLWIPAQSNKTYTMRVLGADVVGSGSSEQYALAWSAVAVPEPSTLVLLLSLAAFGGLRGGESSRRTKRKLAQRS